MPVVFDILAIVHVFRERRKLMLLTMTIANFKSV